jgi:hypothetical protein
VIENRSPTNLELAKKTQETNEETKHGSKRNRRGARLLRHIINHRPSSTIIKQLTHLSNNHHIYQPSVTSIIFDVCYLQQRQQQQQQQQYTE